MNEIQVFNYQNANARVIENGGEPWWVLKEVCDVLEIGNSRDVAARLDDDEKGVGQIDTLGGKQNTTIVNESGLYAVILRSDKPQAKSFRKWVTSEVLPSIRKTGSYTAPKQKRSKPEDVIFRQQMNIAKAFSNMTGVPLEIATATAINIIEERTGFKYDHWKLALPARTDTNPIPSLNSAAVGELIGASAQDVNKLLESVGLQIKENKNWRLTDKGKQYGEEFPFERNGHSDYRILWRADVKEVL